MLLRNLWGEIVQDTKKAETIVSALIIYEIL